MEQVIVTHKDGSTFKLLSKEQGSFVTKLEQKVQFLGVDTIDLAVQSCVNLDFIIGDKITIIGRQYTLNLPAKKEKVSETLFTYEMQFEGVGYDLLRANYSVNVDTTSNTIQDVSGDSLTGDLKMFLDVLISNANRVYPSKWSLGTYPSNTETRTETFGENDNCLGVLQSLCSADKYNTEFKIDVDVDGNKVLNVGSFGDIFGYTFQFGKGKGLYNITRDKVSTSNIITRLYAYGSSKNIITSKYRASKLCLPTKSKSISFIENSTAISAFGIWEYTKNFENVFPERIGTVSSIDSNILKFSDSSLDFDLNAVDGSGNSLYLISGTSAKIDFTTGNLAGYSFELSKYEHSTKTFTINQFTDDNGYKFPNPESSAFQVAIGDKYIISDIYLPQSYIDNAESRLETLATDYLETYSKPRVQYSLDIDKMFLRALVGTDTETNVFWVGDYIPVYDSDMTIDNAVRITEFTRNLLGDFPDYKLTLSDFNIEITIISRLISEVNGIQKIVKFNNLKDPAKARRNWLASQEVLSLVFDTEGQYYSEKIKPLSIETTMLSVGAKSQQLGLTNTEFQPNYLGFKNRIKYTGGVLAHYTFVDSSNNPRIWNLSDGDVTLSNDGAFYIYAKCSISGDTGTILFSTSQIIVDSDGSFYHFLLGVVNSVNDVDARSLYLTFGFTTINGRFIRTGRVVSQDGTTFFDLDENLFQGNFKFSDGTPVEKVQTVINGGIITTGTIEVGQGTYGTGNAGITGEGNLPTSIRDWAGSNFASRDTAPFRVQDNGKLFATDAEIEGVVVANSGSIGGFDIADGRIGGTETADGLSMSDTLIRFKESTNLFSGIGTNVETITSGLKALAKFEIDYSSTSAKFGTALKTIAIFDNSANDETSRIRRSIDNEGNFYSIGGHAIYEKPYIGEAFTDTLQNYISITHSFVFTSISATPRTVYLPSASILPNSGSGITYELKVTIKLNISNTARITSVSGGQIVDNDGNSISYIDLAHSDTLILRYFDSCYYIVSLQRDAL